MNENNLICRADIQYRKATKIWTIWYVLFAVLNVISFAAGLDRSPERGEGWMSWRGTFRLMFVDILDFRYREGFESGEPNGFQMGYTSYHDSYFPLFLAIALFLLGIFLPIIVSSLLKFIANGCSLSLTKDGIQGVRKTLFSTKNLQLPIEKVDSVMVSQSIFNKLGGGKTVAVRSNSGLVKFPWCHNADEFVAATLQRIEEFKKETSTSPKPTPSSSASLSEKLQELQSLKEQGILTEEQFEAKKQQLLSNF